MGLTLLWRIAGAFYFSATHLKEIHDVYAGTKTEPSPQKR